MTDRAMAALAAYDITEPRLLPVPMGNINETYYVDAAATPRSVLQRLNPIFKPEIHHDIDLVTQVLEQAGIPTPRLIRTRDGALWTDQGTHGIWRLQTYIHGVVHDRADAPALCRAGAHLLGRFHHAVGALQEHSFRAPRLGVHDTARHMQGLRDALQAHPEHCAFRTLQPLAHSILTAFAELPPMQGLPHRVVHGDPKLNNIIFAPSGEAVALIDLDTLNSMPVTLELGDAMRSWCNPAGEDNPEAHFSMPHFAATLEGYAEGAGGLLQANEIALLPTAMQTIALELAARFARDVLEERYFGWNRSAFSAAWQHHLVRTRSQLSLALSYAQQQQDARALVQHLFRV